MRGITPFFKPSAEITLDSGRKTTVWKIESFAFDGRSDIKSVVINPGVTIREYAFYNCTALTSVVIHPGTTIEHCAFQNCKGLTSIVIHQGAIIGGRGKLAGLKALTSIITRHDGVTTGKYALGDCTNLRSVYVMCGQEGDQVGWSTRNEEFAARHTKAGGTITFIQERVIKEIVNKIARDLSVNFLALFTAPENLEMFAGRQLGEAIGTGGNNHFAAQQQLTAEQLKITRRRFMRLFSLGIRTPLGTARKETIPVDICNAILTYVAYQNQGIDNSPNEVFTHSLTHPLTLIGDDDL